MKKDKLEQFVISNREAFDDLEPGPRVWTGIENQKKNKKRFNLASVGLRAAAVVVIFITSYYFHDFIQKRKSPPPAEVASALNNAQSQKDMYRELQEAKYYYTTQIEETRAVVFKMIDDQPDLQKEIDNEMLDLDKVLKEMKSDLKDNVNNEEVIVAMIQNYRLKLKILNDIRDHLNSSNKKKNNNETKRNYL